MLRLVYTSTKVADSQPTSQLAYIPSIDAFHGLNLSSELDIVRRVYRDGTLVQMGTNGTNAETMHYSPTVDEAEMYLWSDARAAAYAMHPISWTFDLEKPLTGSALVAGDWSNDAVFWREPDTTLKYLKKTGIQSIKQLDVATGADEGDTAIFSGGDLIDFAPMLMGGNLLGFCSPTTGRIKVLDWVTKDVVLDSFITAYSACAFDRANRLFLSIRASDDRMQLWEENIEPFAVSTPVATPGLSQRYTAETMSVIVTGSNGELVEGVLVDWTVVENPGMGPAKGKMSPAQSKTNSAGVATSVYCPPGLDWVLGDDELITATVTV